MNWLDNIANRQLPTLAGGSHNAGDKKACLMELISVMEGEEFSDHPVCVSRALCMAGMGVNDGMSDGVRNSLLRLAPMFVGTRDEPGPYTTAAHINDKPVERSERTLICPFTGYRYRQVGSEGLRAQIIVNLADAWISRYNIHAIYRHLNFPDYHPSQFVGIPNGDHIPELADAQTDYLRTQQSSARDDRGLPPSMREPSHHRLHAAARLIRATLHCTQINEQVHQMLAAEAVGALEAAIKVGPHTPEMRGWLDEEHIVKARAWAKEYA